MRNTKSYIQEIKPEQLAYAVAIIISIIGFIQEGFSFILGLGVSLLVVRVWLRYRNPTIEELNRLRYLWLRTIIEPILPQIRSDTRLLHHITSRISNFKMAELGIQSVSHPSEHSLPDIVAAEKEMTQLEERASLMLGTVVFIPVLFALLHIFRSVSFSVFLLEIFCALLLGLTVVESQAPQYRLQKWDTVVKYIETYREELVRNPRKLLSEQDSLDDNYRIQELGLHREFRSNLPAIQFFNIIIWIFIDLLPEDRINFLKLILKETKYLPQHQRVLEVKWDAYKTRVLLISVTATALSGLFVSMAVFSLPRIGTSDFSIQSTPYLWWGQYLLVMSMNIMIWSQWYDKMKIFRYALYFTLIYVGFYSVNSILY